MNPRRSRAPGSGSMAKILAERERDDRVQSLEWKLAAARGIARRLWRALSARRGEEWDAFDVREHFGPDVAAVIDEGFDAAERVWEAHRIVIEPCSRILDEQVEGRDFVARWPDGSTRNLTRDQLLMLGGGLPA